MSNESQQIDSINVNQLTRSFVMQQQVMQESYTYDMLTFVDTRSHSLIVVWRLQKLLNKLIQRLV